MTGNHGGTFRGRDRERDLLSHALTAAASGKAVVLLVEGRQGIGKTRLLAEAAIAAAGRGFTVATAADELEQPFLLARVAESDLAEPTLIVLDDLHLADPGTLAALRTLLPTRQAKPVLWLLARCPGADADRLFVTLAKSAVRIELGPLPEDAVAGMVADLVGTRPEADLLALAAAAEGNPADLTDLIAALCADGQLQIDDDRAWLQSERVPSRVETLIKRRVSRLSGPAQHLVQVAAVLGPSFRPGDAAEMLSTSTAVLLPALGEALTEGVLVAADDRLAFRHELIWRLVAESVPPPVRRALHREAGEMLLARGDSAVPAAEHLLHGAQRGDVRAIEGLATAARELLLHAPEAAAELAVRALELTDQASTTLVARTVVAVQALAAAGKLSAAQALAQDALARQVPGGAASELRYVVAVTLMMSGHHTDAVRVAERLLAQPVLSAELRPWVEITLLVSLLVADPARAAELAEGVVRAHDGAAEDLLSVALAVLSAIARDSGQPGDACALAREAAGCATGNDVCAYPQLLLATQLACLREFTEADGVVRRVRSTPLGIAPKESLTAIVQSRILLQAGRLEEAATEARAGLAAAEEMGHTVLIAPALAVLATVALHTGDLPAAIDHVERFRTKLPPDGIVFSTAYYQWTDVLVSFVASGIGRAMALLNDEYSSLVEKTALFVEEPRAAAWFVRRGVEAGDQQLARAAVGAAERLADENPAFRAIAVAAVHARGVLENDAELLSQAALQHRDMWARANATEDLGVLLASGPAADRPAAVKALENALGLYREIGASRDGARVLGRLRKLGRRRRTQPVRPASGWSSLDDTERAIANLVAKGQTNRQISTQLFMSPHTVNFHLRKIFRKLGINSRVELMMRSRDES